MSGFSAEWLALREPADHGAINARVREACVGALGGHARLSIVDLGSGTGSNLRSLSGVLGGRQHWTLVDLDQRLLDVARSREGEARRDGLSLEVDYRIADLSAGELGELLAEAGLVTASALFDLVSSSAIRRLAGEVAARGCTFYTVLTYDGIAAFLPEHPADRDMRAAFNDHQRTDKGFGPAAGPDASDTLAAAFTAHGYTVIRGKSPWVLDGHFRQLRHELDRGWAAAVRETGLVSSARIDDWLAHRLKADGAVTIVGHEDLLALAPGASRAGA